MPAIAAIKIASIVLSIPGCETLNCSAIAIIAAPTIRTSTQERWYSPHCTKVALGSGKMSFPATNRTRIYTKPGKYLSRLLLSAPRTCAAVVALLASGPSAVLAEVLAIIASHKQMGGENIPPVPVRFLLEELSRSPPGIPAIRHKIIAIPMLGGLHNVYHQAA